jgi:hypothetical protein
MILVPYGQSDKWKYSFDLQAITKNVEGLIETEMNTRRKSAPES